MTHEQINIAIARHLGVAGLCVIMKRGLYYRPNARGYTKNIAEAWKIPEAEAKLHGYPHDEVVTVHPAPIPNYAGSLDAMHEARKSLKNERQRIDYMGHLHDLACVPADMGWGTLDATAAQHAKAFLRTLNLWTETPRDFASDPTL